MALFQISEPGMAPAPHQRKLAVGIDLGTTNSLVASVKNSIPEVLLDESGNAILPSIVHYGSDKVLVGKEALANASEDPQNTILSTKRLMGRSAGNLLAINQQSGYKFAEQSGSVPAYITVAGNKTPLEVSAEILKVLIERAQATLGGEIEGAVITVPAYFDDAQRQATKDAARLADINVLRLLNEPTAAALAYGLDKEDDATFVVYDLGGGTFDVTILQYSRGVFEVLSTGGDSALGGDDFDHLIAEWVVNTYAVSCSDDNQFRELIMAAKKAKESLSEVEETMIALSFHSERCLLKRDVFDELVSPLINKTIDACKQALKDAEVKSTAIDNIIMVGGSTRMLSIREAVGAFFNQPVMTDIDPDRVVALGAAIQADILVGNKPDSDLLLLDVIPLSLGIETMGGLVERIIERNTTIPIAKAQEFTTYKDGQTAMAIHVVQGERDLVEDSRSLARFELKGIPPMAAGAAQIRVTYQVDADGLLSVTAKELNSGVESSVQVKPSYGLSDDEITKMLHASFEHAGIDKDARALREQQVDADRLIVTLQQAMIDDGDELLNDDEKQSLETAISTLLDSRNGQNVNLIKENIKQLSTLSESFAAKRMDAAIKKALTGHALDDLDGGSD